jgi:hypothetical protein
MAGAAVYGGKHTEAGDIVSGAVVGGNGGMLYLDDDCCFSAGFSSPSECARIGEAVGTALREGAVAVCGRGSGAGASALLAAFGSGLASAGVTVISVGKASVCEVMFLVNRLGAELGCHIGADFSERIRLMSRGGLPLPAALQSAIERSASLNRTRTVPSEAYGEVYDFSDSKVLYRIFLSGLLPKTFRGVNADVRCPDSDTLRLADGLVRQRNDIDGKRVIFHISNDGRGCTAYTDPTGYVTCERLIMLAAKAAFEKDIPVSLPYSFPMAADGLAEAMGGKLYRYYHLSRGEDDRAARLTAERPDNFFVRDGAALMCVICAYLSERGVSLSEALGDVPQFYSAQRFVSVTRSPSEIYGILGCRRRGRGEETVMMSGDSRAVVRPLKNRRGLLIFAESAKAETASELCGDIMKKLK